MFISGISTTFLFISIISNGINTQTTNNKGRHRRNLIFEGGGVNKIILGTIYPLYLEDHIKWRQLNCGYNLQAQYSVPTSPLYFWNKWEGRNLKSERQKFDKTVIYFQDDSRKFVFIAIESIMNNKGKNGHKCLLRAICENAQITSHIGIFSEVLHTILTPGKEDLQHEYLDAFNVGKNGVDCLLVYPECPKGDGFEDAISQIY